MPKNVPWYKTRKGGGVDIQRIYNHLKLIVIEKTIAALLLAVPGIWAQLRQKIALIEGRADQAALNTHDGLRILRGPESLLNYYLAAIFVVGHLVHNCTWARRADRSGIVATCVLQRYVGLLVHLAGPAAAKMDYLRTYAALFRTIRNGRTTRLVPPMWRNVVRPCSQNCRHGASNTPTSTRRMRLVTFSARCPPISTHVQRSPCPKRGV